MVSGTLQSSPAIPSPSGSLSGSQDDSDSDMAFSVNQSSSASESSLGKENADPGVEGGAGAAWLLLLCQHLPRAKVASLPRCTLSFLSCASSWKEEKHLDMVPQRVVMVPAAW